MPITTGPAPLPPIGELSYNGVTFSALYRSEFHANPLRDKGDRTIKCVEVTLDVEGLITLPANATSTDESALEIRRLLEQQGGTLVYVGNGTGGVTVNAPGNAQRSARDVAWGPVPKLLGFKPLGAGGSVEVSWQVTTWILDLPLLPLFGVLQLNFESSVSYDDEGYSAISMKGTLEVPFNRTAPGRNQMQSTVDNFRQQWLNIQIDLTNFRPTRRTFGTSRDKRTIEWEFAAEELPPMGLPKYATKARGVMSVRPMRQTRGTLMPVGAHIMWTCTLKVTYTIRKDYRPDNALLNFYSLLWYRMRAAQDGRLPVAANPANANNQQPVGALILDRLVRAPSIVLAAPYNLLFRGNAAARPNEPIRNRSILVDFGFDEGLHLDSKTMTFEATWILLTTFRTLMRACGAWKWPAGIGGNQWAASMTGSWPIMGWKSWLENTLDPSQAYIIDAGAGLVPYTKPLFNVEAPPR